MKQLLMQCNMIYTYYDAVRFDFDSIHYDAMEVKIRFYAIQYGTV